MKQGLRLVLAGISIALIMSAAFAFAADSGMDVEAGSDTPCDYLTGTNVDDQWISAYGNTIKSYLVKTENGYMKVQAGEDINGFVVEYYDSSFNRTEKKTIESELPVWGGFYEHGDNYYIVTGQNNFNESDQVEVYRITKFDKSWGRVASAGFYGEDTYIPFDAGSCRMAAVGDQLVVHTCHEMYALDDGEHHQSNYTVQADMDTMEAVAYDDRYFTPYSSHSFNQFIRAEGNEFVTLDHGDAYPRALMLSRTKVEGKKTSDISDPIYVMEFKGNIGMNETGATVGGMEFSDSSYIIAGTSVDQDDPGIGTTRNIFVAAVDKQSGDVRIRWITKYKEDGVYNGAGTPLLVKINSNRFAVLWSECVDKDNIDTRTRCTFVDGSGNLTGSAVTIDAKLSDCQPIVVGSSLVWYTWADGKMEIYRMPLSDPSGVVKVEKVSGHSYVRTARSGQSITIKCSKCGKTQSGKVAAGNSYDIFWTDINDDCMIFSPHLGEVEKNDIYQFWINGLDEDETEINRFDVSLSDDSLAEICGRYSNAHGDIRFKKEGTVKIYFYPRYMPEQKTTVTIEIKDPSLKGNKITAADKTVTVSPNRKKYALNAKNSAGLSMKYSSNNQAVKVDEKGTITVKAKYIGKAVITITTPTTDKYRKAVRKITVKVVPPKTKLTSVKAGKKKATVRWKKQLKYTSGYQIQYAMNKDFKKAKKVLVTGKAKTKKTVKGLRSGKRYYVRVRTYKTVKGAKYYSLWSKVKTVKVR